MSLSATLVLATLPSGSLAVYEVWPQHLNLVGDITIGGRPATLNDIAVQCGAQLAHEKGGVWYERGKWQPIADERVLAAIQKIARAQ